MMSIPELRDAAAKILGWNRSRKQGELYDYWRDANDIARFRAHGSGHGLWAPDCSHDQAALLLAEVERRGLQYFFCGALDRLFGGPKGDWHFVNATPEQKTRAAVEVLTDGH